MKTLVFFLAVLVLFSSSSSCLSAQTDNKEKPKPIEQLLSQKRDLLKQRLDIVSIRFAGCFDDCFFPTGRSAGPTRRRA